MVFSCGLKKKLEKMEVTYNCIIKGESNKRLNCFYKALATSKQKTLSFSAPGNYLFLSQTRLYAHSVIDSKWLPIFSGFIQKPLKLQSNQTHFHSLKLSLSLLFHFPHTTTTNMSPCLQFSSTNPKLLLYPHSAPYLLPPLQAQKKQPFNKPKPVSQPHWKSPSTTSDSPTSSRSSSSPDFVSKSRSSMTLLNPYPSSLSRYFETYPLKEKGPKLTS